MCSISLGFGRGAKETEAIVEVEARAEFAHGLAAHQLTRRFRPHHFHASLCESWDSNLRLKR
jgi:hypothetical protein